MRQRVPIARAFATGSPVLLMDEPLGALDAQTRMLMQEELIALWETERKTVLMVTHDIDEAIILGDRVIVMSGRPGTLREDITVPFERPRSFDIERSSELGQLRSNRSEEHTSELQSRGHLVCRPLLEKKNLHEMAAFVGAAAEKLEGQARTIDDGLTSTADVAN